MSLTLYLIGLCVVFSLLGWLTPGTFRVFGLNRYAVFERGEVYRILTHAFFHADIFHLLINCYVFYNFGQHAEPLLGIKRYAVLLVVGLLGSAFFSMLMRPSYSQTIGIGFSGVVSAVVFCMIVFYPKMRLLVFFVPMPAWVFAILYTLYSLYAGQGGEDGIDHWAHLGGAGAGAAYALLVRP
jgi:membrane associated rhomboid family serine protease